MAQAYYPAQGQQQYGQPPPGQGMPPPPKPPRKNPYRDGISRSEQYYDLYYMIRSPNVPKADRPPDPPPQEKRKLSKQKRLELEIQKKFETKNKMPGQRLSGLTNLIRILFLVLVLPPYMVVYGIPKWFFAVFIPSVFKRIEQALKRVGQSIKQACLRCVHRIVSPFKRLWQLIKDLKNKKEEKVVTLEIDDEHLDFLSFIAKGIIIFYNATIRPMVTFSVWSYRTTIKTSKALYAFPARVNAYIEGVSAKIKQRVNMVKRAISKTKKRWQDHMRRLYIQPVQEWVRRKKEAVSSAVRSMVNGVVKKVKGAYAGLKQAVLNPVQTGRNLYQKVRFKILAFSQKMALRVKGQWQAVMKRLRLSRDKCVAVVDRFIKQPLERFRARLQTLWQKYIESVKRSLKYIQGWIKQPHLSMPGMPQAFSKVFAGRFDKWRRARNKAQAIVEACKKQMMALAQRAKSAANRRYQAVAGKAQLVLQAIGGAVAWAALQLKEFLLPYLRSVLVPCHWMKHQLTRLAMRMRLGMAWVTVLCRYGMRFVTDAANSIVKM